MDEEIEMKKILDSFESSLKIIEHIKHMSKDQSRRLLDKITKEIDTEDFVVDIELPRIWNTAAFLHVILNEYDEALIYARKSSEQYAQNINSKIIQAFCHLRRAEFFESRQLCDELEELRGNKMEVLLAKAEMAFTYSRLGLEMFELAENAFKEIFQQCLDVTNVPASYVCLWKFGLALTMKRGLNMHCLHEYNKSLYSTERAKTVFKVFTEVAETEDDTVAKYVARACVELGLLMNDTEKGGMKGIALPGEPQCKSQYYFVKALKLCPNDMFVLERSGKYYRYNRDIQKSIELLSKAVGIRSTSFGHHHLALSLKRQLEMSNVRTRPNYRTHFSTRAQQHHVRQVFGTESRATFRGRHQHSKNMRRPTSLSGRRSGENYHTSYHRGQQNKTRVAYAPDSAMGNIAPYQSHRKANESKDQLQGATADSIDQITTGMSDMDLHESTVRGLRANEIPRGNFSYSTLKRNPRTFGRYQRSNVVSPHYRASNECLTQRTGITESGSEFHTAYAKDKQKNNVDPTRLENQSGRTAKVGVKQMVKSPKKIKYLEPDETTDKIMFHLDEAYKLNNNVGALYDKGLVLRQLKKGDKALAIFIKLVTEERTSLMLLANSYEQAAFCLIGDESADEDPAIVQRKQYNIKMYLKKSIEIGFTIVAKIPLLCEAWESLPTLKNLLGNQVKTKGTLKELAFVHEKMQQHKDAIGCYKQIVKLEESEDKKTEVHLKIVENYLIIRDYDEAVLCLDIIMCLPEVLYKVNPELFLSTYIEGGIDAVKRGETNIAGLRLRKALDYNKSLAKASKKEQVSVGEFDAAIDNEGFDIYIYCDESVEDQWRSLKDILIHAGLHATLNSDDNRPGAVEFWGMLGNLEISTHCIIIAECNEETLTSYAQVFVDQVLRDRAKMKHSNVVVVREEDSQEMTSKLTMFQSAVFRPDREYTDTRELSQDTLDELKKLMYQLATPRK